MNQTTTNFNECITLAKSCLDDAQDKDYDWTVRYGETYLNVAIDYINKAKLLLNK